VTVRIESFVLRYEKRPWTLNVERQNNRWQRAKLVAEWRAEFARLATDRQLPALPAVHITAIPHLRNRASMPDTGACIGAAKAAIDGLVDAGVLAEDGPKVVLSLLFVAPEVTGIDALELEVRAA
jgi:hypothetical protein